jgi:hypothetical protein
LVPKWGGPYTTNTPKTELTGGGGVWNQHQSSWLPEFVAEFVPVHIRLD